MAVNIDFRQDSSYIFSELLISSQPEYFYFDAWGSKITIIKADGARTTAIVDARNSYPDGFVEVKYDRVNLQEPVDSITELIINVDEQSFYSNYDFVNYLNDTLKTYLVIGTDIEDFEIPEVQIGQTVELNIKAIPQSLVWYGSMKILFRSYADNSLKKRLKYRASRNFSFTEGIQLQE